MGGWAAVEDERSVGLRERHPDWVPERLAAARVSLGWSRATLARKIAAIVAGSVEFTPPAAAGQMIMRHERGWTYPGEDWQAAYGNIMGLSRVDLGFCARVPAGESTVTADALPPGPVFADDGLDRLWTTQGLTPAWEEVTALERRDFLALSGTTLVASAHQWLIAEPSRLAAALGGKRVDAALIADLTSGVDLLRRLDDKLGGHAVYGMTIEQLRLVISLLRNTTYSEMDGRSLQGIAAELARLAGWTSYDAARSSDAQRFYLVGLRAAHEAGDRGIGANILRCMAHQARTTGDLRASVDILRSARRGADGRLSATERSVIAAGLARTHGYLGDRSSALAAADEAYSYIELSQPESDPPYVYWVGRHTIASAVGNALLGIGDPHGAVPHLQESVESVSDQYPRDRLEYQAILAIGIAQSGNPDGAIDLGHQAITDATSVTSHIAGAHLAELVRAVRATGHRGATDLADHARTVFGSTASV